jgi:protein-S-isoprenylcysteine O-methyltransferase Ste14
MHARSARIRFLLSIIGLPIIIGVVIPIWLARCSAATFTPPGNLGAATVQVLGGLLLIVGAALFGSSLYQIATRPGETLAPWDPPRRLVVRGPYRFVRNPMISGVIFVLFGEALGTRSVLLTVWAAAFLLVSVVYTTWLDESQLEARFGDEYRRYLRGVPRFLPRLRPWSPENE